MLTSRAKAYSSSGLVVTHRSINRARRRVTSFQSKRVSSQFSVKMCAASKNCEKFTKNFF